MSVTAACLCAHVGGCRGLVLSLHYKGMTTNEEICRATLHCASADRESVTHVHAHAAARETCPFTLRHCGSVGGWVGGGRTGSKRKRKKKITEEQISGLNERQRKRGVTKKKRSRRVKWRDRGGDGWQRRGVNTTASSTRLQHSSNLSFRQRAGGVDRTPNNSGTSSLLLISKLMCLCERLYDEWCSCLSHISVHPHVIFRRWLNGKKWEMRKKKKNHVAMASFHISSAFMGVFYCEKPALNQHDNTTGDMLGANFCGSVHIRSPPLRPLSWQGVDLLEAVWLWRTGPETAAVCERYFQWDM